jgi:uncharacterized radical SAM superfamily protein
MSSLSPEVIWNLSGPEMLNLLYTGHSESKKREIHFYAPSFAYYKTKHYCSSTLDFSTISLTGKTCALNCRHCGAQVLRSMSPALTTTELFEIGLRLKRNGAKGCLVSGGCLADGSMPLDPFVDTLRLLKQEFGLTVFVHTGIIKPHTALALRKAKVDAALIDIIGSEEIVRRVYNLNLTLQDYSDSLKALQDAELPFVPHVIVGLNDGKLDGEFKALQLISQFEPSALVIIAFMPILGTAMAKTKPPKSVDIAKVSALARLIFPSIPLALGCMRPKGASRDETDVLALRVGVDAIAFPSNAAIEYSKSRGYETIFSSYCCAQICADIVRK